jgi:hypothetical protein
MIARRLSLSGTWLSASLLAIALIANSTSAFQGRRRAAAPGAAPAAGQPALALSKGAAIQSTITALMINRTDASERTLEKVITGEIDFGGHAKQAAQLALLGFALQPSDASDAFLVRIFTDADDRVRPGNTGRYTVGELRTDAVRVLGKVGSSKLRVALAKAYSQEGISPLGRTAIEELLKSPHPASFPAQVELLRSTTAPDALKLKLQKIVLQQNVSADKQALKLEASAPATAAAGMAAFPMSGGAPGPAGGGGGGASLLGAIGKMFGGGGAPGNAQAGKPPAGFPGLPGMNAGKPPAGSVGPTAGSAAGNRFRLPSDSPNAKPISRSPGAAFPVVGGANAGNSSPEAMMLEMMGQMISAQPVDPAAVARELWNPEFANSLAEQTSGAKTPAEPLSGLASLPIDVAREKLKEFLGKEWGKGPKDLGGNMETVIPSATPAAAAKTATLGGRGRNNRRNEDLRPASAVAAGGGGTNRGGFGTPLPQQMVAFGTDWFDPGSLVVLKTIPYEDRPKEKGKRRWVPAQNPARMSERLKKKIAENEEKRKLLEMKYEWRDAVHKVVAQWNERFSAVAEAGSEPAGSDSAADPDVKPAAETATKSAPVTKSLAAASGPVPSVALPFSLHPGGKIAKEYHARWPQDLPAAISSVVSDPLTVHYVRFEGPGEIGKALTHYHGVLMALPAKPKLKMREIENGKWLDALQKDPATHRTRSVDIFLTREETEEDKGAKAKVYDVTIEILVVEINALEAESTPSPKKEARESTKTTAR